jgi:hypothetical protein
LIDAIDEVVEEMLESEIETDRVVIQRIGKEM